jgi:lactate permease
MCARVRAARAASFTVNQTDAGMVSGSGTMATPFQESREVAGIHSDSCVRKEELLHVLLHEFGAREQCVPSTDLQAGLGRDKEFPHRWDVSVTVGLDSLLTGSAPRRRFARCPQAENAALAPWPQSYDPLHSAFLSTLAAAIPIVVLLGCIASGKVKAHLAALIALLVAFVTVTLVLGMPWTAAVAAVGMGAAYGLLPIGWIVLNILFLYQLTKEEGAFDTMQASVASISTDRRVQLVMIAFALGAFFEGTSGFGTPVAITGALLIGIGFSPLQASTLSLIANTAPVAFGAMGTPIFALQGVTGIDANVLSMMVGRQLPVFSLMVPFWLIGAYDGLRGIRAVWPILLVAGISFAVPQFLMSNFVGPSLVDVVAGACSMLCVAMFARVSSSGARSTASPERGEEGIPHPLTSKPQLRPWLPWIILCVLVFVWGLVPTKAWLNGIYAPQMHVPWLDGVVQKMPPVVAKPQVEAAVYAFNILSATGTSILLAALIGGAALGFSVKRMLQVYGHTVRIAWRSILTIVAMMSIGYLTRYSGLDAILGLAFARTGVLYPLFGTMLGWLGVALTGSDTASNVLFGSLQKITAQQLGLSPVLMAAANSSGGVMGKMIDAQSIVVASTATRWYGHEGKILRVVFKHSVVLAVLVGVLVLLEAYVWPFTLLVVK